MNLAWVQALAQALAELATAAALSGGEVVFLEPLRERPRGETVLLAAAPSTRPEFLARTSKAPKSVFLEPSRSSAASVPVFLEFRGTRAEPRLLPLVGPSTR